MKFAEDQLTAAHRIAVGDAEMRKPGANYHTAYLGSAARTLLAVMIAELETANRSLESALHEKNQLQERNDSQAKALDNIAAMVNPLEPAKILFGIENDVKRAMEMMKEARASHDPDPEKIKYMASESGGKFNPHGPTPSRYQFEFQGVHFDVYRLAEILGITHHAHFHGFKKVVRAGRGHKSVKQDIEEAKAALTRWSEMLDEDGKAPDPQPHR